LLVDYILANGCRNTAMRAIRDLANRNDTPNTVLRECLTALEANQGREVGLAKRLQIKLSYDLAKIDALPDGGELEPLVDRLLEVHYQSEILTIMPAETPEWIVPTDDRLAWRRRQILSLLQGHPCPFDKIATVRWLGDRVADAIHDLSEEGPQQEQSSSGAAPRRRSHHRRAFRQWPRRMKHWPDHLAPGFLIGLLGPSEAAAKERAKMEEVMAAAQLASLAPPTEADIAVCREELRRVKNPVGLIVARNLLSVDCCHFAAEHQATLAETIALLTQRLAG
jgi:hypothetical protein